MGADPRFRSTQVPDNDVIALLESILESAKQGHVRSVSVVVVNAINKPEFTSTGDLSEVRANALLAGLARASNELINQG